jgi:heat shock protein HtpX
MSEFTDRDAATDAVKGHADPVERQSKRVLVYDRVDANKRSTRNLLIVFALLSLPAVAYLSIYFWVVAMVLVGMVFGLVTLGGGLVEDNVQVWLVLVPALGGLMVIALPVILYKYSAALLLRLSRARVADQADYPDLWRAVENLCIGAGLPAPRLYVIDSQAANAFSTGLNPEESSLAVTTGLLELLDRRELEGVLAHELVQIGNYDTRLATVLAAAVAFLRLPFTTVVAFFRFFFRLHWAAGLFMFLYLGLPAIIAIPSSLVLSITLIREDPAAGWALLVAASVPLYSLFIAPLLAEFIRIAVIRHRLHLADADAVLLARGSEPLATALTKMEFASSGGLNAARAGAHLWTVDPFRDAGWLDRMWPSCHPPVSERVALLASMGAGIPTSVLDHAQKQGEQFAQQHQELVLEHGPDSRSRIFGFPDDEPNGSIDSTAEIAFRLTATTTPVFEQPDTSSRVVQRLSAGALVTVREVAGRFLAVITQDERFGYISDSAPREPVPAPGLGGSQ